MSYDVGGDTWTIRYGPVHGGWSLRRIQVQGATHYHRLGMQCHVDEGRSVLLAVVRSIIITTGSIEAMVEGLGQLV